LILNRQKAVAVDLPAARAFARRLRRLLRLGKREFNVGIVDDREIRRLNSAFRGKPRATDVLSFPWSHSRKGRARAAAGTEFKNFLGDVVISAPTARRNARAGGHATRIEISRLILHGVLHLLGYDHETDRGEMAALERLLRRRLGIETPPSKRRKAPGPRRRQSKRRDDKMKNE
jgi:probable rRNA maturation factor